MTIFAQISRQCADDEEGERFSQCDDDEQSNFKLNSYNYCLVFNSCVQ